MKQMQDKEKTAGTDTDLALSLSHAINKGDTVIIKV
jgi:hypothetical protein